MRATCKYFSMQLICGNLACSAPFAGSPIVTRPGGLIRLVLVVIVSTELVSCAKISQGCTHSGESVWCGQGPTATIL